MTLSTDLDDLADDLWKMAQCPRLNEAEQAELYDAADRCANAAALTVLKMMGVDFYRQHIYAECDTIRSKHIGTCLVA